MIGKFYKRITNGLLGAMTGAALLLSGCGTSNQNSVENTTTQILSDTTLNTLAETGDTIAYFGDPELERVIGIDIENMVLDSEVYVEGTNTYTVEQAGKLDKLYAITRGSNAIEVIDINTSTVIKKIELAHFPRSTAYNEILNLQLVSGIDKAMTSVIDVATDTVVSVVGDNTPVSPIDYGGSNATGHPVWLTPDTFAMLDRAARMVKIYQISQCDETWSVTLKQCILTKTSPHHIIGSGNDGMEGGIYIGDEQRHIFYIVTEGSQSELIAPELVELQYDDCTFFSCRSVALGEENIEQMGAHHASIDPSGAYVYMGSTEGVVRIIDLAAMSIITTVESGLGSAHTTFVPQRNLAIITNHMDTFVTVIDTTTHTKVADVTVSGPSINGTILQSHTTYVDPEGDFFYAFATDNGIFYELDLDTLEISRTLYTGGTPKQGCVVLFE